MRTELRIRDPLVNWIELDEADPGDEHEDVTDLFRAPAHGTLTRTFVRADGKTRGLRGRDPGYFHAGFNTATPISVPSPLVVRRTLVTVTCPGRSRAEARRVGTAATPHRVAVQARVDATALEGFPGWWQNNGHLPFEVPDLHDQAARVWRDVIRDQQRAGVLSVTARDTNDHSPGPLLAPVQRTLTRPVDGIDKIVAVPGKGPRRLTLEVLDRRDVDLTIDGHDAKGVLSRLASPATGDAVIVWIVVANIGRKAGPRETRANIALVRRGFRR